MSKFYVVVSVESETLENVSRFLDSIFGGNFEVEASKAYLGIFFDIEDRSDEYQYASSFLVDEKLDEDFKYPKDVDVSKFGVEVDLYTAIDSVGYKFIDVIGDSIAAQLSAFFGKKVMLRVGEMDGPLFIYDNGIRSHRFDNNYAEFFKNRNWCPNFDNQ